MPTTHTYRIRKYNGIAFQRESKPARSGIELSSRTIARVKLLTLRAGARIRDRQNLSDLLGNGNAWPWRKPAGFNLKRNAPTGKLRIDLPRRMSAASLFICCSS
jgi:hypothetical protein